MPTFVTEGPVTKVKSPEHIFSEIFFNANTSLKFTEAFTRR